MLETQVRSLGQDDLLEKEVATHSRILTWEIPWTEEPRGLQSMGLQKSGTWLSNQTASVDKFAVTHVCMCTCVRMSVCESAHTCIELTKTSSFSITSYEKIKMNVSASSIFWLHLHAFLFHYLLKSQIVFSYQAFSTYPFTPLCPPSHCSPS